MKKFLIGLVVAVAALVAFDYLMPEASARAGLAMERMRCGLEAKTMKVGDWEIAYLEGGLESDEAETLVLVHGFGADKDNFTRTSAYLKDRFHIVIPDLPGFGDSTRLTDASYAIPAQVERLHTILQAMGHEKFWMGGSSMGGAITATYAATYPDEVSGVWLLAPGGVAGAQPSELFVEYQKTGKSLLIAEKPEDFETIMYIAMEKNPWVPYSVKHVLAHRAAKDYPLHKRIFDELADEANFGINKAAGTVQSPALIVWGTEDRALHVSGAGILDKLMPNSQAIVMEGIGHLPMMEAPKQAAQDFLAFVDSAKR